VKLSYGEKGREYYFSSHYGEYLFSCTVVIWLLAVLMKCLRCPSEKQSAIYLFQPGTHLRRWHSTVGCPAQTSPESRALDDTKGKGEKTLSNSDKSHHREMLPFTHLLDQITSPSLRLSYAQLEIKHTKTQRLILTETRTWTPHWIELRWLSTSKSSVLLQKTSRNWHKIGYYSSQAETFPTYSILICIIPDNSIMSL